MKSNCIISNLDTTNASLLDKMISKLLKRIYQNINYVIDDVFMPNVNSRINQRPNFIDKFHTVIF